jgi:hypothetical protein
MAIPSINNLIKYINSKLTGANWNANFQAIVSWLTDGTAEVSFKSVKGNIQGKVTGDVTGNVAGNVAGNLIGDVYASNGTSIILDNGTDGKNAIITADAISDYIQTKTSGEHFYIKNSLGKTIATFTDAQTIYGNVEDTFQRIYSTTLIDATPNIVISGLNGQSVKHYKLVYMVQGQVNLASSFWCKINNISKSYYNKLLSNSSDLVTYSSINTEGILLGYTISGSVTSCISGCLDIILTAENNYFAWGNGFGRTQDGFYGLHPSCGILDVAPENLKSLTLSIGSTNLPIGTRVELYARR